MIGHKSVNCKHPIKSYGIIVFKKKRNLPKDVNLLDNVVLDKINVSDIFSTFVKTKNIYFLVVQRKHSIAYIDFMRGKWKPFGLLGNNETTEDWRTSLVPRAPLTSLTPRAPLTSLVPIAPLTSLVPIAPLTSLVPIAPLTSLTPRAPLTSLTPRAPLIISPSTIKGDLRELNFLFSEMTPTEQQNLINKSFDQNSTDLWNSKKTSAEYTRIKEMVGKLDIASMVNNSTSKYLFPSFGFPKGRKKDRIETDINTALREFEEETGYSRRSLSINPDLYITEKYRGYDGIFYQIKYWISEFYSPDIAPTINPLNKNQFNEIGSMAWLSYEECLNLFNDGQQEKKKILTKVYNSINIF